MIIEIIENGGIYCYKKDNQILYIGKTKQSFSKRDAEHKNEEKMTAFEKSLQNDETIEMEILYDCRRCPLTAEQLDYLETCFIYTIKPFFNIQKTNQSITKQEKSSSIKSPIEQKLTKSAVVILNTIEQNYTLQDTFTKKDIWEKINTAMSETSINRGFTILTQFNIIQLLYSNNEGRNVYQRLI